MLMFHFDDRSLKEAEREARKADRVLTGKAVDRAISDVLARLKPHEEERQLIIDAREGNAESITELLRRYWKRVYNICYGFVWNKDEAERLAKEACDKVLKAHRRLDPDKNFGAYFAKTAENCCKDWLREEQRQGPLAWGQMESIDAVLEDEDGEESVVIDEIADPTAPDPEKYVLLKLAVERVLQRLPPIQGFVLWQRYVLGYSRAEIATMAGCTEQNVGYHERHAKAQFRKYFIEEWGKSSTKGGKIL